MGFNISKPSNLRWLIYSLIAADITVLMLPVALYYVMSGGIHGYPEENMYIIKFVLGLLAFLTISILSGLTSIFYIWKHKTIVNKEQNSPQFKNVLSYVVLSFFTYPPFYLVKCIFLDSAEFSSADSPVKGSSMIALIVILISGVGGVGVMAFVAMFAGIFWVIAQSQDQSSPAEEKLNPDEISIGRTLLHKMLGGKGKK